MSPYRYPPRHLRAPSARLGIRQLRRFVLTLFAIAILTLGTSAVALLGPVVPAYAAGNLSVRIFEDLNRNGAFDSGEAFAPAGSPDGSGVPVAVYNTDNTLVGLNNTLPGGTITFPSLPSSVAGRPYRVEVVASAIGVVSVFGGAPPPNTLVSFINLTDGAAVNLDVGLRLNGNFGGTTDRRTIVTRVWDDFDSNGIQDAGEPGLPGVTLQAIDTISQAPIDGIPDATTNADGYAVFSDTIRTDISFSLRVTAGAPAGYLLTRQDVNDNQFTPFDQRDSDAFLRGGTGPVEVLVPAALTGQNDDSIDIGFTQGAISGFVFRDRDPAKNGLFTSGIDEFLNGVEVQLFDNADTLVFTQTTRVAAPGNAGFFEFGSLPLAGSPYRLVIPNGAFNTNGDPLFGAASSPNPPGGDRGLVNGVTVSAVVNALTDDVQIPGINLTAATPGTSNISTGNLFGFYQGTLGDLVALDANRNGTVDPEDASLGIPGVVVFVDDGRAGGTAGNRIRETSELSTTTNSSGRYRFDNVPLGLPYDVVLDRSNFDPGGVLEGLGSTNAISVTLVPPGRALFLTSNPLGVAPNDDDLGVDFGIRGSDVGSGVWEDTDGDGLRDLIETGVPSVTVRIFRATTPPTQVGLAQVTDATGAYTIPNLIAGSYFLEFDLGSAALSGFYGSPIVPAGYTGVNPDDDTLNQNDLDFNGDLAAFHNDRRYASRVFTIAPASDNFGVDVALYRPVTLAGLAFYDEGADDLNDPDPADPGVPGIAVQTRHLGGDGIAETADDLVYSGATTAAAGAYSFAVSRLIPPGLLQLEFRNPDPLSFGFAAPDAGTPNDDTLDSDITGTLTLPAGVFGFTEPTLRESGTSHANIDAGFTGTTQVGGTAFVDDNANGLNTDPTDGPMPDGTEVTLVYSFTLGTANLALSRNTTTTTGAFTFTAVPSSTFSLTVTPPVAIPPYITTFEDEADNTATDSDGASATDGLRNQTLVGGVDERRDVGFFQYVQAAGRVFFDANPAVPDGLDDPVTPEPGMRQVTVRMLSLGADNAVGGVGADADQTITTTTGLDGTYAITASDALRPGNFTFEVQNPSPPSFAFVPQNAGTQPVSDSIDSDVDPLTGQVALTLGSGVIAPDLGAGFTGARNLIADAFVDNNGDGVNNDSAPLAGITTTLTFTAEVLPWLPSVALPERGGTTDATGLYTFTEVTSGTFDLSFTPPPATPPWQPTFPDVGDPSLVDSDGPSLVDGLTGQSLTPPGDEARSQGFVQPASVSGEVWFDSDGNDSRDPGDAPLTGVTVEVINLGPDGVLGGTDNVTATLITDSTGAYSTTGTLPPGRFIVQVTNPSAADFAFIPRATPDNGSDVDTLGVTAPFTVTNGANVTGVDAGLSGTAGISGKVFVDDVGDGQSVGDPGLPGATVRLTYTIGLANLNTTFVRTLPATPVSGTYSFDGLPSTGTGSYTLTFTAPSAFPPWVKTYPNLGPEATDSDGDQIGATLNVADPAPVFDQGYYQDVLITLRTFQDTTLPLNNIWNATEPALPGVSVTLEYDGPLPIGEPQRPISSTGASEFDGLLAFIAPPGQYRLVVTAVPAGFTPTVGNTGTIVLPPLTSGQSSNTQGTPDGTTNVFGYIQLASLSGTVWFDVNDNGARDTPGDLPLEGVTVSALLGGTLASSGVSDATGAYTITDLLPGTYVVSVTNPSAVDFAFIPSATPDNGSDVNALGVTAPFTVTSAGVTGVDAGLTGTAGVSGKVFVDSNGDGQSVGDPGLPGATVQLTYTIGLTNLNTTLVRTLPATPVSGTYSFGGLPGTGTGSYTLTFTAPVETPPWAPTLSNVSPDATDSDGDQIGVTLNAAAPSPVFDQGYVQPISVTGELWFDNNNNGTRDPGEGVISGATVEVISLGPDGVLGGTDDVTATVTTDTNGVYATDGTVPLPPGRVVVRVPNPSPDDYGFVLSGADSDLRTASGTPPTAAQTDPFTVASGVGATGVDAGLNGARAISGIVFEDSNGNGRNDPDPADPPLANATVTLTHTVDLTTGGATLTTTISNTLTTTTTGTYRFAGLPGSGTGSFTVTFTAPPPPPSWQPTIQNVNGNANDNDDSDGDPLTGEVTGTLTTASAAFDQGYFRGASISGRVWFDTNGNGTRDGLEPPLTDVTVELINVGADGVLGGIDDSTPITLTTDTATTTAGQFLTTPPGSVLPGTYVLRVINPDTTSFAFNTTGTDNDIRNTDSATPPATGWTEPFVVASGSDSVGHDAGLVGAGTIQGLVFVDQNADGQNAPDPVDPPLAGATVDLSLDVSLGTFLNATLNFSATTDAAGTYSIPGLPAGTISNLTFTAPTATPPWQPTLTDIGNDASDSDGPLITGESFTPGAAPTTFDQGFFQDALLAVRVFDEQVTINNSFDPLEIGIPGVSVSRDNPATTLLTDGDGVVTFTVSPGSYTLTRPTPAGGFTASPGNDGDVPVNVISGETRTVFFGYYKASTLTGTAWFDSNRNGLLEVSEPGMQGITVTLVSDTGAPIPGAEAFTSATGAYTIDNVEPTNIGGNPPGYRLCFGISNVFTFTQKTGTVTTDGNSDANADGCSDVFQILGSNNVISTTDAGYLGLNRVGDLVWSDTNGDGVQNAGEDGVEGALVTLSITTTGEINVNNPTVVMTATSTASTNLGPNYFVTGVPPNGGFSILGFTPPTGFVQTPTNVITATEQTDGDAVGDRFAAFTGEFTDVDFGLTTVTSVGNFVWLDLNGNGLYDTASEGGAPGVTVRLLDGGAVISSTVTGIGAQAGLYSFEGVAPGTYSVRFEAPAGYVFTNNGLGAIAIDNDNDARTDGTTVTFTLSGGQQLFSVDAGLRGLASISGLAWLDNNRNNQRDANEGGRVSGVTVTLTMTPTLTPNRSLSLTTTTGTNGTYSFNNLPEGTAQVVFTQPPDLFPVTPNIGPDTTDSDGPVATVNLSPGSQVRNVDMGYRRRGSFVFLPLVHGPPAAAELSGSFTVTPTIPEGYSPAQVTVTVTNTGNAPATNFWVDLYINPSRTPQVNDRWNDLCGLELDPCLGIAWFYTGTLNPGQSITLTSSATSDESPNGFMRGVSSWPGYFINGTSKIYVLVDSWNRDESGNIRDPFGAIQERDETNNLSELNITVTRGEPPKVDRVSTDPVLLDRATFSR